MNTASAKATLDDLEFDNRFTRELPADPGTGSARRQVREALYSRVRPTPGVGAPSGGVLAGGGGAGGS